LACETSTHAFHFFNITWLELKDFFKNYRESVGQAFSLKSYKKNIAKYGRIKHWGKAKNTGKK
jgi:hypothetical protein